MYVAMSYTLFTYVRLSEAAKYYLCYISMYVVLNAGRYIDSCQLNSGTFKTVQWGKISF